MHLHKMARSLFRILEEEELSYPSSENKGADQLCSYCIADLRLCFRKGKIPRVFFMTRLSLLLVKRFRKSETVMSNHPYI